MISPLPGATPLKPGSATRPFCGVRPVIVDAEGKESEGVAEGNLGIAGSWPGQMRPVYGDHARFVQTSFSAYPGMYFAGDGRRRDARGYYWDPGRVTAFNTLSGHRMHPPRGESRRAAPQQVTTDAGA